MALTHLVVQYESNFCSVALQFMEEEKNYPLPSPATTGTPAHGPLPAARGPVGTVSRPQFCQKLVQVSRPRHPDARSAWPVPLPRR